jgi:hypothetical protein
MIDVQGDIARIVFGGDFDEPVTLTQAPGESATEPSEYTFTGIFTYQVEDPDVENVTIADAKKLTLTIATASLLPPAQPVAVIIHEGDTLTIRTVAYGVLSVNDNLHGLITVMLGE